MVYAIGFLVFRVNEAEFWHVSVWKVKCGCLLFASAMSAPSSSSTEPISFSQQLHDAEASFDGLDLVVSTGKVRRVWRVVSSGLSTCSLKQESDGAEWIDRPNDDNAECDWSIFHLVEVDTPAVLSAARAIIVPREGSIGERLQVEMVFQYPSTDLEVRYVIWVFSGAEGIRTQLGLRALNEHEPEFWPGYLVDSYAERLCLAAEKTERLAAGYYNDTQHRNSLSSPMLKEEQRSGSLLGADHEIYDWANILHMRRDGVGLALIKESHKCVNQEGVDTGAFVLRDDSVTITGLGLRINGYGDTSPWIRTDAYHEAWANWCVLYAGDEAAGIQAVKRFDRQRFPFDPDRDVYMNANTWGSRGAGKWSQEAAEEENVLKEIESCADLGIDVLQIDDGWALDEEVTHLSSDWKPLSYRFPVGWKRVKAAAESAGLKLGLWFAWTAPLERMIENCDEGGFLYLKLDFASLDYRHLLDALLAKAKALDAHNEHRGRINWDLTELSPRMGYFLGREYGHLFVRNTQWARPGTLRTKHVDYLPEVWLRDAWQYARHLNLNQIYLTVQNKDRFDPKKAGRYSHSYCFAITMMGVPTFFQETHLYTEAARDELRPLISLYKQHRAKILGGYATPIGDQPNGGNWTGFHCRASATEGYLTVFREIDNQETSTEIDLPMMPEGHCEWTDLLKDEVVEPVAEFRRKLRCSLPAPGEFLFLSYRRLSE